MKITFDSNVWRIVASPETFPNEKAIDDFKKIRKAIDEKRITPFLCETIFTLEAIQKRDRKEFFSNYRATITTEVTDDGKGDLKLSVSMGPDNTAHPGNNSYLEKHLKDAIKIGFEIIKLPRLGGVVNPDIEKRFYEHADLNDYLDKVFAVGREIEDNHAGIFHIKEIGQKYDGRWTRGIEKAPAHEDGNIAKAIAEWADGDSVACHIAAKGDFFCTRDTAQRAGSRSVFSPNNLSWLKANHNLSIISPEDLAKKC